MAFHEIVRTLVESPDNKLDFKAMKKAIGRIGTIEINEQALIMVIKRLTEISSNLEELSIKNLLPLINSIKNIKLTPERCTSYCYAYSFLYKQNADKYTGLISDLLKRLENSCLNFIKTTLSVYSIRFKN